MRKVFLLALSLFSLYCYAEKSHYIPYEWTHSGDSLLYSQVDTENKYTWSESRSRESDNVIVYWDKYYGDTAPDALSASNFYYVDIDDLLEKCEAFYRLECDSLGFVDPDTSNISKYKIMVLMNHTTEWTCYGSGYDYEVPALWLNPSTCKPVGSAVAHEVGHSFHYMCYSEDSKQGTLSNIQTGFHGPVGNGAAIWETTANWQALQSYPGEIFTESYTYDVFPKSHNYAFSHEWHRYQAYMFLFYLCQHYGDIKTVANVWNYRETKVKDFNEVLMDLKGLDAKALYGLHFDFAMHAVTWDLDACRPYLDDSYIGNFVFNKVKITSAKYQVAYSSCPQGTGFNVIELNVPVAGTEITTHFTALVPGCALADDDPAEYLDGNTVYSGAGVSTYNSSNVKSARGFRLGYVMLLNDGSRQYIYTDSVYCTGTADKTEDFSCTVPENVSRMWLVVAPSLKRYQEHKWDEDITDDDQWPYQVEFVNTDISGEPTIDGRAISDAAITYDVSLVPSTGYDGVTVKLQGEALAAVGTAMQLTTSQIKTKIMDWDSRGPSTERIMFYAAYSDSTLQQSGSTANGYGHWFDANGNVVSYGTAARVYSEFNVNDFSFAIGQYPGANSVGDSITIIQALYYLGRRGTSSTVYFVFHIHFVSTDSGYSLLSVNTNSEPTGILPVRETDSSAARLYNLRGQPLYGIDRSHRYIYIAGNRKVIF